MGIDRAILTLFRISIRIIREAMRVLGNSGILAARRTMCMSINTRHRVISVMAVAWGHCDCVPVARMHMLRFHVGGPLITGMYMLENRY
jgi:hypothetical protein